MSSIKNPDIKHFIREGRYICNGCVDPTPEKSVRVKRNVTCRNCLIILNNEQ